MNDPDIPISLPAKAMQHSFAKNTVLLFVAQIVTKVLGFIVGVLLANYLDVEGFGQYNFALAFTALFIPLCDLGVDIFLTRELASLGVEQRQLIGSAFVLKSLFSSTTLLLIGVVVWILPQSGAPFELLILAGTYTILKAFSGTYIAVYRASHEMQYDANSTIVGKVLDLLAIGISIILQFDLTKLFLTLVLAGVMHVFYTYALFRMKHTTALFAVSITHAKHLLRGALPFALSGITVVIFFQIDSVLLSYLTDNTAVGIYRSGYNLIFALTGFSAAIVVALFPHVAQNYQTDRTSALSAISSAVHFSILFALPIAITTTFLADGIINILYEPQYAAGAMSLRILAWWLPLMYVANILGHVFGAINLQKIVLWISIGNVIINVTMNLILIPLLRERGAAIATVATELIGMTISLILLRRRFGNVISVRRLIRLLAANVILTAMLLFTTKLSFVLNAILACGVYTFALFATRAVTWQEIASLFHSFMSRKNTRSE